MTKINVMSVLIIIYTKITHVVKKCRLPLQMEHYFEESNKIQIASMTKVTILYRI
jgi:hypothetical protein